MRLLAVMLAALSTALPAAAAPPSRVELTFAIMMGDLRIAEAREVFEHDGRRYQVVSESTPKGIAALFINDVRRESRGAVTAAGLRPEHFEETGRRGGTRVAKFDWTAGELTLVNSKTTRTVALPQGTLDQASLAYALAFRSTESAGFNVHVTDGRGVKQYRYREIGVETLNTPLGELRTRRFEKVRDPGDKRGFEFWLATDRDLLPVKLRYLEKNGDVFDSIITAITSR
ncbi:MAG TPA: DUF3108 domain-containing protein [Burkholderiales bacterium]|nr:DUF3108 domain-containing protein [Burkholderiales bacterium]